MGNLTVTTYAILRIKLCREIANFSISEAGYVGCATCVITRGVSHTIVSERAFGDAFYKT